MDKIFAEEDLYWIDKLFEEEWLSSHDPYDEYEPGTYIEMSMFIKFVKNAEIMDYDGIGFFAEDINQETNISVICDPSWLNKHKGNYKYVVWYNK
jgi:hypothetical protein